MRVLICGDRLWGYGEDVACANCQHQTLEEAVGLLPADTVIIEGEARGADLQARRAGERLGLEIEPYPADWKKHGRTAGPIRNKQMLVEGEPDLVLAFHDDIENSKGTKHMVKIAREAGVEVQVIVSEYGNE